jgi:RNA polymerase sigma-70 factor (ECF subfamily)
LLLPHNQIIGLFLRLAHRSGKNNPDQYTDQEIITRYREDKNQEWIGILFDRYTHLVLGVCLKYLKNEEDSKDAVMQIFENLSDNLLKHKVDNFKTWLYTLTRNHCLMQLRKKQTVMKYRETEMNKLRESIMEFTDSLHHNNEKDLEQMLEKLSNGIGELSEEQSECIKLMYLEEKSYKEIAYLTGYDLKQVKSYIQNGKRNLQKILSKGDG